MSPYRFLYDATVNWYLRPYTAGPYVHVYVVLSLSLMAFLNTASLIILCAYWRISGLERLLVAGSPLSASLMAGSWLAIHVAYSSWRRRAGDLHYSPSSSSRWVAGAYMMLSVGMFLYVSTLVPSAHQ